MKTKILTSILAMLAAVAAQATLYTYSFTSGFTGNGVIPDGNVTGWSDTRSIPDSFTLGPNDTSEIVDVNVRLNISGGYNGDLYGYLVHSSGFAVLLNRTGRTGSDPFGYADAGFNITLGATGGTDIHSYHDVSNPGGAQLVGGSWVEDGRNVNPALVNGTETRDALLSSFATGGQTADGSWTLFLSDMASGYTSTLVSWGLDIEVVPEPTTWALIGFAFLFVVRAVVRKFRAWRATCPC